MYIKAFGMDRIDISMRHVSELIDPQRAKTFVYDDTGLIVAALGRRKTATFTVQVYPHSVRQTELRRWSDPTPIPQAFESDLETFITATIVKERLTS